MKRRLLDQLSERHDFQVPQSMVDAEFQNIMQQLRHEASHEQDPQAALAEIESEADEYRGIAERRVRLGLLLSEIGAANGVEVSQQEMNRLIAQAAQQYQGKDRERFVEYIQQEPMAAAQLRAPLYEDKVVDFLFSKADVTERKATREELEADLESEEGHVHGPGCGHDLGTEGEAKPKAKAKGKKKTAAKGSKADAGEASTESDVAQSHDPISTTSKPSKKAKLTEEKSEKPKPAKPKKAEPHDEDAAKAAGKGADKPAKKPAAKKAKASK
jgi:trigger factor